LLILKFLQSRTNFFHSHGIQFTYLPRWAEEILSLGLKITTNPRITFYSFALEWFIHAVSLQ